MEITETGKEFIGEIDKSKIVAGDGNKYSAVYIGSLYLPPECIGRNIRVTVKVDIEA